MEKILIIEYCNSTPHIETSIEIAKRHLELNHRVYWYFWGHAVPFSDWIIPLTFFPPLMSPERRGIRLIKNKNLNAFFSMPKIERKKEYSFDLNFNSIDDLINFKWNNIDIGVGVASSFISMLSGTPSCSDFFEYKELIQQMIASYILSFHATIKVSKKIIPDYAYVFNGRFCCQHATASALKKLNIPVYYHERGASKDRYHVRKFIAGDRKSHQKNILNTWQNALEKHGEKALKIGEEFFVNNRKGVEQGWIAFNANQKTKKLPDFPKNKIIISYFHSSDDEYIVGNKIFGNSPWNHQIDAFQALLNVISRYDKYHLIVRLHPHLSLKNKRDQQLWLNHPIPKNCTLITPESDVDSYSLIEASKMVFTYGSTIGIESIYWGIPSILLGNAHYDQFSCVIRIESVKHLIDVINKENIVKEKDEALAYGYYMKTFGEEFRYYKADNLFEGKFLGKNLQKIPRTIRWMNMLWRLI